MNLWTPEHKPILPPGLLPVADPSDRRRLVLPGERGFAEALEFSRIGTPGSMGGGMASMSGVDTQLLGSNAFNPGVAPGLVSYFNADLDTYLENTFSTPQNTNGGLVGGWKDQNGNANPVSSASGHDGERLTLSTGGPNGHRCVKATGTTQGLFNTNNIISSASWTIYTVVRIDTWNNVRAIFGGTQGTFNGVWTQGSSPQISNNGNNLFVSLTVGTWGIVMSRSDGANAPHLRLNTNTELNASGGTSAALNGFAVLGDILSGHAAGDSAICSIAYGIYYNQSHGTTDQNTVINGLNAVYAVF